MSSGTRCVAELLRSVRRGSLLGQCATSPKATLPTNPLYRPLECRSGSGVQAEAIAQARLVGWLNSHAGSQLYGDPPAAGGISANEHWEVAYPKPPTAATGGRVDVMTSDRANTAGPIELIELKQRRASSSEQEAIAQLTRYSTDLPRGSANRVVQSKGSWQYRDFFRVLVQDCGGATRYRVVNQYDVQLSTVDSGAVLIDMEEQLTPCPRDGDPPLDPVPEEQPRTVDVPENHEDDPRPPVIFPAPGRDSDGDGHDDHWERWLEEHPELEDLPEWPALPVDPVPADATIEIPWETVGIIALAAATCILWCSSIGAGLAAIGTRLAAGALAEAGSATVGAALTGLGTVLAGLIGWNLWGDPHMITLDQLTYDLQSVGEFHLLEVPEAGIDVQARFRAAGTNVSVLDRIATEVNEHLVEIGPSGVKVDGQTLALATNAVHYLGDGAFVARDARGYTVAWPGGPADDRLILVKNGDRVGFHVPSDPEFGQPRGLLGNHDGDPQNDLALRDGTPLPARPGPTVLHGTFADSWRITDTDSLFPYGAGESTATYTDLAAPRNVVTTGDFSTAEVTAATETCAAAGVEPGPQFDGCVIDVLVTGDQTYAASAALVTDVLVSADGAGVGPDGNLSVDFEGAVPANFVAANYLEDQATTRIAGPVFDANGYRFYVRDLGRHDDATLAVDVLTFGPVTSDAHPQSLAVTVNKQARGTIRFDDGPPRLSDGLAGTIESTGSGTTAAGLVFDRHRVTLDLGVIGDAADLTLTPDNFHGVLNTSIGFDDIDLQLTVPPAQHFMVSEPFAVPSELPAGAGALESGGAADVFEFEVPPAAAGSSRVINPIGCVTELSFLLVNLDTGERAGTWGNTCGRIQTDPLPAGTYALTVTRPASAGAATYALEVFVLPAPQQFSYQLATVVKDGAPGAGAGVLETAASIDVYTLTSTGKNLLLDFRACFPGLRWALRSVLTGVDLASGVCSDRALAGLDAGTYELRVSTQASAGGAFGFQVFEVPVEPQDFAVEWPLTVRDQWPMAGAGHLETHLSVDRYTFTVPAPAPLYVDIQRCLEGDTLDWRIVDTSTGATIDNGACLDHETAPLPAGTYRLEVTSATDGIGPYELQAWLTPMAPEAFAVTLPAVISQDRPATGAGNLETKASQDIYTFTVTDTIANAYVDNVTCSTPDMLTWRLVTNVAGVDVTVADGDCQEPRVVEQLATGDYRLVVTPQGEHHGTYGLRIVAAEPGSPAILHVPQTTAYYGKPIPIDVTTTCRAIESCHVQLVHRTTRIDADELFSGSLNGTTVEVSNLPAGNWVHQDLEPTELAPVGDRTLVRWTGEIPATTVTTTGVDYYLVATDGDDRNELPDAATAPAGANSTLSTIETAYFHVTTLSPPLLAHLTPGVAQADTDVPLQLTATCSTASCTATLHYRTSTGTLADELLGDPGWATITMDAPTSVPLGDLGAVTTFTATIPGTDVDTRGVDYYFDVTDTHTTAYWPGTTYLGHYAPRDGMRTGYHTVHVLESPHIVHTPVATTPYREPTPVEATANCPATRRCTARLYYRTTTNTGDVVADSVLSTHDFADVAMNVEVTGTASGNHLIRISGEIPSTVADTRGIDYFFRVDDGSTTTWFPGTGQLQGYVNVDGLRVGFVHTRVLEPPHITPQPQPVTRALEPYTVTSTMTCVTEDCSMTLYWRNDLAPGETDTGWHAQPMALHGTPVAGPTGTGYTFTATIPAEKVTTRGLAYFLEAFDGYVHDYSPGTSYWGAYLPLDGQHVELPITGPQGQTLMIGAYMVRVLEPPHLAHVPQPVATRNAPHSITAASNCSSSQCTATLTWTDSAGAETSAAMTAARVLDGDLLGDVWQYTATIPGTDTGAPFTYAISVTDGYTSDATPPIEVQVIDPLSLPLPTAWP